MVNVRISDETTIQMVLLGKCGLAEQIHCCDEHLIYEAFMPGLSKLEF